MANRYGEAALIAANPEKNHPRATPLDRWNSATAKLYPTSPTQQRKGGPRNTFLGLCEAGLVKGIPAGPYTKSADEKEYATRAVELLRNGTAQRSVSALWRQVCDDDQKPHNSQMDVVLALWKNNLIEPSV